MFNLLTYLQTRLSIHEISGSLGDLGTFLPIVVALGKLNVVQISSTFFWAGISNIILGCIFDTPLPVQPMKTIASAAINGSLDHYSVMTSGFFMGVILLTLAVTNTLDKLTSFIPTFLIASIQLAQGISFMINGVKMVQSTHVWFGSDSYMMAIGFSGLVLCTLLPFKISYKSVPRSKLWFRYLLFFCTYCPSALILFIVGCIIASVSTTTPTSSTIAFPAYAAYTNISSYDFQQGFLKGTIPQLPLTLLNSVVAVVELNNELFASKQITMKTMALTVGSMNVFSIWFGGMPACCGCGGLSGQYKFGARTGLSIIMLGVLKIIFACVFGSYLQQLMSMFPLSILGLMLIVTGIELGSKGVNKPIHEPFLFSLSVGIMLASELYIGFLVGLCVYYLYRIVFTYEATFYALQQEIKMENEYHTDVEIETTNLQTFNTHSSGFVDRC